MTLLINHDAPAREFLSTLQSGRLPHAWLLTGPEGLGKAHFAMQAALTLLEWKASDPAPDRLDIAGEGSAAKLIAADAHPEFLLMERPVRKEELPRTKDLPRSEWPEDIERTGSIPVDLVRHMIGKLSMKPAISQYRVIIIDAIDDMAREAANAILKILEEPPEKTIFLCISHAPDSLLPTIRSRCRVLRFAPLGAADMDAFLQARFAAKPPADRAAIASLAEGSPGRALAQAHQDFGIISTLLQDIAKSGDLDNSLRNRLAAMVSGKTARDNYQAVLDAAPALAADIARQAPAAQALAAIEAHQALVRLGASGRIDPSMAPMIGFEIGTLLAGLSQRTETAI